MHDTNQGTVIKGIKRDSPWGRRAEFIPESDPVIKCQISPLELDGFEGAPSRLRQGKLLHCGGSTTWAVSYCSRRCEGESRACFD